MEVVVAAVATALVGATAGALAERGFSRRRERLETTLELFRSYNSQPMLDARRRAWRFMRKEYRPGTAWRDFFADAGDPDNIYGALVPVLYFWQQLLTLHEARDLDNDVSKRLFQYQFRYWQSALEPLAQATRHDQGDFGVDWLPVFDDGAMSWLLEED